MTYDCSTTFHVQFQGIREDLLGCKGIVTIGVYRHVCEPRSQLSLS